MPSDLTYTSGSHTITSAFATLRVGGTAVVILDSGASGVGHDAVIDLGTPANTTEAIPAIWQTGGTLTINAGTYTGGAGCASPDAGEGERPAHGLLCTGGALTIAGGTFNAGTAVDRSGFSGAFIGLNTSLAISGGTFNGGSAAGSYNLLGGTALVTGISGISSTFSGATVSGGSGVGTGSQGYSLGFDLADTAANVSLTTGTYTGQCEGWMATTGAYMDVYTAVGLTPGKLAGGAFTATFEFYGIRYTF